MRFAAVICLSCLLSPAFASPRVQIVPADLKPLIRRAAESPVQFAVPVTYAASPTTAGDWSAAGDTATWQLALQVPTAVSLSFHAVRAHLPASAVLTVRGATSTAVYRAGDIRPGDFWSRIQPGDTLQMTLDVASGEKDQVGLEIVGLEAGYRSLAAGVEDHPYLRQLRKAEGAGDNSACAENFQCHVTGTLAPSGQGTVALVVSNIYQCSGVLLNDVPGDAAPYVLTARHCETGQLGGGAPGADSSVTVYWDAASSCSAGLASIYDSNSRRQTGAKTVVEQEDAWLLLLNDSPVVPDAQFIGFDATGAAVLGGYTVHHARGLSRQFTTWYGNAASVSRSSVLDTTYQSHFWYVTNNLGTIGSGASGSGLFDQNNRVVGTLSLGLTSADSTGYQSCPASSPAAPTQSAGSNAFTSLAAVWNSTADKTSTTGGATLRSVLDPAGTGIRVTGNMLAPTLQLTPGTTYADVTYGNSLNWNAPGATQCVAGGGLSGDGWTGTLPASGSATVAGVYGGLVIYRITCSLPGNRRVSASASVTWYEPTPSAYFTGYSHVRKWTTRPATLTWQSNVGPCSVTGGTFAAQDLPAVGSVTVTESVPGDVGYHLKCGAGSRVATAHQMLVTYETPNLVFQSSGSDRQTGSTLQLMWDSAAETCVPSGGAPGDNWTGFSGSAGQGTATLRTPTLGSFTYTMTCSSGSISLQKSVPVTVESDPGYVTLSTDSASVVYSNTPADYIHLQWATNLDSCELAQAPVIGNPGPPASDNSLTSSVIAPYRPVTSTLTMTCVSRMPAQTYTRIVSNPLTITVLPPPPPTVSVSSSAATVGMGQQFTLSWSSTDAKNCRTSAETANVASTPGGMGESVAGSWTATPYQAGQATFGIYCDSIDASQAGASASVNVAVEHPTVTFNVKTGAVTPGQTLSFDWSSTYADSCTATGGGATTDDSWGGTLAPSGSLMQTATVTGTFTYTLDCGVQSTGPVQITVTVSQTAPRPGGGGGASGWLDLAALLAVLAMVRGRRRDSRAAGLDPVEFRERLT